MPGLENDSFAILRNRSSTLEQFRKSANQIARKIAHDSLSFQKGSPLLVPILRAGLVLLPPFLEVYLDAAVGLVGIRRNEKTAEPQFYYANIPEIRKEGSIFLLDPMLATGQSAAMAIKLLIENGAKDSQIILFSILAAPEGMHLIKTKYPNVRMSILKVDQGLDAAKFIVPGLGDFGDRYFGT